MEDQEKQYALSGLVNHKIYSRKENIAKTLLDLCVLESWPLQNISNEAKLRCVQKTMQYQYLRVMQVYNNAKLRLTYAANCCPCGYYMKPRTRVCNDPVVCPWCFVRRWLIPIHKALSECNADESYKILIIKNYHQFFTGRKSPHYWLKAKVTVQLEYPSVFLGNAQPSHAIFQVVPANTDYKAVLSGKIHNIQIACLPYSQENILQAIKLGITPNWYSMFHSDATYIYSYYLFRDFRTRNLRINKETKNGTDKPSVS